MTTTTNNINNGDGAMGDKVDADGDSAWATTTMTTMMAMRRATGDGATGNDDDDDGDT